MHYYLKYKEKGKMKDTEELWHLVCIDMWGYILILAVRRVGWRFNGISWRT